MFLKPLKTISKGSLIMLKKIYKFFLNLPKIFSKTLVKLAVGSK